MQLTRQATAKHAPKPDKRRTKIDPFAVAAIRLLILTGARLREILDAQWQHVDLERGVIFLPELKTGRKPRLSVRRRASGARVAPSHEGNPHIIPGEREGAPRADLKKPWAAVRKAAGLDGVRLHDSAAFLREHWRWRVAGPAHHRQAARPFPSRDNPSVCASRRGPAAARGRDNRRDNFSRDGRQKG